MLLLLLLPLPRLQGYQLMTPLRQQQQPQQQVKGDVPGAGAGAGAGAGSGRAVMVNRGWVPKEWREDEELRRAGQPTGKVRCDAMRCDAMRGGAVRSSAHTPEHPQTRPARGV